MGVSFYPNIIDYWRLGAESVLGPIAIGAGIPAATAIESDIGKNYLLAADNLSCSVGPYDLHNLRDDNQYDNMNYNSLLPRSDFQYSWIRQTLSGSSWMDKQKVRGYAPKSGEVVMVGNGALTKLESAIEWPLMSDIECCVVNLAVITVTTPASNENSSYTKTSDFTITILGSDDAAGDTDEIWVDDLQPGITWAVSWNNGCCPESEGEDGNVYSITKWKQGDSVPAPSYSEIKPAVPNAATGDGTTAYLKFWAKDCEGNETTLTITASGGYWS